MADSSTLAMPSIDLTVGGNHLAGRDDDLVAEAERRRSATSSRDPCGEAAVRDGRRTGLPELVRLCLAAALGDRLGEVREEDGEPEPDGHEPREDVLLPGGIGEVLDEEHGDEEAAELDDEQNGIAGHPPRVELERRSRPLARLRMAGSRSDLGLASAIGQMPSCSRIGPNGEDGEVREADDDQDRRRREARQRAAFRSGRSRRSPGRAACVRASRRSRARARSEGTGRASIASPSVVLYQSVFPVRPPKAEPLLFAADVKA